MQSKTEFEAAIGQTFQVALEDGSFAVKLTEVAGLARAERAGGGFSAVFEGPEGAHLEQGLYRLTGAGHEIDVFLVPIGPFGQGMGYEAVYT
ncbi:MAG: hypothetical protein AAGK00_09180 [Pseudomonadota bacterium]